MSDLFDALLPWGLGAIVLLLFCLIGWAIYDESTAETFELRKDQWVCTASHEDVVTMWTSGPNNTMQPIFTTTTVCDRWERRR